MHVVFGILGLLGGIGMMLLFGGLAALIGFNGNSHDDMVAIPILGVIFGIGSALVMLLSLPSLIGGIGLLNGRNWGRVTILIVSALELLKFPVGTAIGAYSLWVLTNKEAESLIAHTAH